MTWLYKRIGSTRNPPVIFLHGFLGDHRDWDFLGDAFATDFDCILPDLPGHGANLQPLPGRPCSFRWLAAGLVRTLDDLEIGKAHLVGYSMGGRLALYFAVTHPGRVASLVLESASPGLAGRRERQERRGQDDQRAAEIRSAGLDSFIERWYQQPLFQSLQNNPEKLAALKAQRKRSNPEMVARLVAELSPGRQPSMWKRLAAIQAPVLLLTGAQDEKYTAIVAAMAGLIPQARARIAPQAGHAVHLEEPVWYTRQLSDFLAMSVA